MFDYAILQFLWFTIFVALLTGYAILDGFDLGVGMMHLFSNKDIERRLMLNSIGPVWDGNEVWLVTAGGALFAGFPAIYATLCTTFYVPLMILLGGLIFRAVAIEFRSKRPAPIWRWTWDILFSLGSLIIALSLGLVLGNMIRGLPLNEHGEFIGTVYDLINPYALLISLLTALLFLMHGCIYLLMKTEDELHDKLRIWIQPAMIAFIIVYGVTTAATLIYQQHMTYAIIKRPFFFLIAVLNMLVIANIPREIQKGRDGRAFISSCLNIVCLFALFAIGTYPNAVKAINDPSFNLTIYNSASSEYTLKILLLIAAIGAPLVLAYTITIYWVYQGKVKLETTSY